MLTIYYAAVEDIGTDQCSIHGGGLDPDQVIKKLIEVADTLGFQLDELMLKTSGSQTVGGYIWSVKEMPYLT